MGHNRPEPGRPPVAVITPRGISSRSPADGHERHSAPNATGLPGRLNADQLAAALMTPARHSNLRLPGPVQYTPGGPRCQARVAQRELHARAARLREKSRNLNSADLTPVLNLPVPPLGDSCRFANWASGGVALCLHGEPLTWKRRGTCPKKRAGPPARCRSSTPHGHSLTLALPCRPPPGNAASGSGGAV
jgi:hypothetical protein